MDYAGEKGWLIEQLVNDGEFEGDIAGAAEHVIREMLEELGVALALGQPCTRPPKGWRCTRGYHAHGPCAAIPG